MKLRSGRETKEEFGSENPERFSLRNYYGPPGFFQDMVEDVEDRINALRQSQINADRRFYLQQDRMNSLRQSMNEMLPKLEAQAEDLIAQSKNLPAR